MRDQDLATVRQALEAALRNLKNDGGEGGPGSVALLADQSLVSDSHSSQARLIVVLAGDQQTPSQDTRHPASFSLGDASEPAILKSGDSVYPERKVSHPGLERFTIETDSHPSAPKTCFMESGRTCVNSGACEMRGF